MPCTSNSSGETARENLYKSNIYSLFNNHTLRDRANNHQYDVPLENNPNGTFMRLGFINFENTKARKIIDNVNGIIDMSYVNSKN